MYINVLGVTQLYINYVKFVKLFISRINLPAEIALLL